MSDHVYAKVREKIIEALNTDLIGPIEVEEMLDESPLSTYITGMLYPLKTQASSESELEDNDFISDTIEDEKDTLEEDYEDKVVSKFKQQSSIGLSFYVSEDMNSFEAIGRWGKYTKDVIEREEDFEERKQHRRVRYRP